MRSRPGWHLCDSYSDNYPVNHSDIYSSIYSLIYSFISSLISSFTSSFTSSFISTLTFTGSAYPYFDPVNELVNPTKWMLIFSRYHSIMKIIMIQRIRRCDMHGNTQE